MSSRLRHKMAKEMIVCDHLSAYLCSIHTFANRLFSTPVAIIQTLSSFISNQLKAFVTWVAGSRPRLTTCLFYIAVRYVIQFRTKNGCLHKSGIATILNYDVFENLWTYACRWEVDLPNKTFCCCTYKHTTKTHVVCSRHYIRTWFWFQHRSSSELVHIFRGRGD